MSGFLTNDSQSIILASTNNTLTLLSGGTIHGGAVVATNGCSLTVSSGTLDGVTVNGLLDVGNTYNGASLAVTNGLTLNGTALVGNPTNNWYGQLVFAGAQSLSGSGTVVFGNNYYPYNALRLVNAGTALILGTGITVRGQNGTDWLPCSVWRAAECGGRQPRDDIGGCQRRDDHGQRAAV